MVKLRSKYFNGKGFQLYLVPQAARAGGLEVKSPLFSPAWFVPVKAPKKDKDTQQEVNDASMEFKYASITVTHGNEVIDALLPWLQVSATGIEQAREVVGKVGLLTEEEKQKLEAANGAPYALPLSRPTTQDELSDKKEKEEVRSQKTAIRKEREEAAKNMEDDLEDAGGRDKQICLSTALLRHILK